MKILLCIALRTVYIVQNAFYIQKLYSRPELSKHWSCFESESQIAFFLEEKVVFCCWYFPKMEPINKWMSECLYLCSKQLFYYCRSNMGFKFNFLIMQLNQRSALN